MWQLRQKLSYGYKLLPCLDETFLQAWMDVLVDEYHVMQQQLHFVLVANDASKPIRLMVCHLWHVSPNLPSLKAAGV